MPANCTNTNPLLHSGTSQWGRVLKALDPSFAQVDERNAANLILFAKQYSQYLNYYNVKDETDGNWLPLMRMDLSIVLATLSSQPINDYLKVIRRECAWLSDNTHNVESELKDHFSFLFAFASSWLYELETQCRMLPDEWAYKSWLTDIIRSALAAQRYKLWLYYDKAVAAGCISFSTVQAGVPLPFTIDTIDNLRAQYWQEGWSYTPDPSQLFVPELHGTTVSEKIKNTAVHNLFTGIFDAIYKQSVSITTRAGDSLEDAFTTFPKHTPHYALLLTFIQLFKEAQASLNTFTQRHLDLYYLDILQLLPKPAAPDHAHVTVTLQKNVSQHLLAKDTLLKAGKDAAGNDVFYAAEKDVVINKAAVAAISSVQALGLVSGTVPYQQLYASPVTNSADGQGTAIKGDDKSWLPFGVASSGNLATVGFAIASHLLFLQEGDRIVTLTFEATSNLPNLASLFYTNPTVQLTGEKDWETATVNTFTQDPSNPKRFIIQCHLGPKATAIVPFNPILHKAVYNTSFPLMRVQFRSTAGGNVLQAWSDVQLKKVNLKVDVSGVKKLVVKNDTSVIDTSKPFSPFGVSPYAGSACIIGSNEIFQKNGAQVKLDFEWDKVPQPEGVLSHMSLFNSSGIPYNDPVALHDFSLQYNNLTARASVFQLQDGSWGSSSGMQPLFSGREMFGNSIIDHLPDCSYIPQYTAQGLFTTYPQATISSAPTPTINFTINNAIAPDFTPSPVFDNSSVNGFVKLELNENLGHKDYIQRFTQLAVKQSKPPMEPYTPLAKSLTATYTANLDLTFTDSSSSAFQQKQWQFFTVYPFGVREEHLFLNNGSAFALTPAFDDEGELYIGLKDAVVNSSVQLLFQVSEGSANPQRTKQNVVWQYLGMNNQWKDFVNGQVSDDTNGLLHSGIIAFAMPDDMVDGPTRMGGTNRWLKGSVHESSDAICNLIDIQAQAIKTIWSSGGNNTVTFSQPSPAGTISKLQKADAAIKSIAQPYDSFGGRLTETPARFYQRSSERLRHKRRAITIWDYEHLVLEAFPQVYKVKCLNHTKVRIDVKGDEIGDNELAPGCVVVVPVPDISQLHSRNPLRPLTSLDTLTDIETYLRAITSGFVQLQARNPVFEEIVIRCDVKFFGNDPAYYHDVLLDDLQQFMCPWAYNTQSEIEFGGKIAKSTLINFIEERSYVDYVTRFVMYLRKNDVTIPIDREEISTSTARSILVSAPKNLHYIEYLNVQC